MSIIQNNAVIIFNKRLVEDILKDASEINISLVAEEILNWLIANVENFIDNQIKIFRIDLILDNAKGMEETKKLQDLYRAIPEPENSEDFKDEKTLEKSQKCRIILDQITFKVLDCMRKSNKLEKLFDRMIFYYEKIIPDPVNKKKAEEIDDELRKLIRQKDEIHDENIKKEIQRKIISVIQNGERLVKFVTLEGKVDISQFEYEAFNVGVRIREGEKDDRENNVLNKERKVFKEYTIPEGFALWLEISYKHKQRPTALF